MGDLYQVECPSCTIEILDLWDLGLPLLPGTVFSCRHCYAHLVVVDRSAYGIAVQEA